MSMNTKHGKVQSYKSIYLLLMLAEEDSWSILCELQQGLKKEFLLVEKEQQEKIKLKREIEDSIRSYHALSIEIREGRGELLKDEGFGNCYNFIKDVIIGISTNTSLGINIIYLAEEQSTLINLIIHSFYENIQTNDPYAKDITKLMHRLLSQLFTHQDGLSAKQKQRVIEAWTVYMQKVEHEHYFQQISNRTLRELLREERKVDRSSIKSRDSSEENDYPYQYSWEVKNKEQLIQQFIDKIEKEAHLCPASIKVPLRAAYHAQPQHPSVSITRTWQLVSSFYLHPFKALTANPALPNHLKERILSFVDDLINKFKFFSQLSHLNLDQNKLMNAASFASIQRICQSLIEVNQERYKATFLVQEQVVNPDDIQIKIVGASLNLIQMHELLILLNTHKEVFAKVNERIIHRTQRIFEMSPNLQILKRDKPALQFVSIGELRYEQSISSDYYKNYTNTYRSQTLKQILKQVLVELQSLGDYRTSKHIIFSQIFSSIVQVNAEGKGRSSLSAQLDMKVKYLIFLLKSKDKEEHEIMREMKKELEQRNSVNIKLFEDTKFSLLKVYCNLRNLKLQLRGRQESERKSKLKLTLLNKVEFFRLDYCLSSRASRNKSLGEQFLDQYRYRMSSADEILISPVEQCIHKENVFTGTHSHASTISRFLKIFTSLPQVKYLIGNPSFMHSNNQPQLYTYCNQNKVREAFNQFIHHVIEKMKLQHEEKAMLQSILYRRLCELLLGKIESPFPFSKDRQLTDKIQALSTQKHPRELQSPRKQPESNRKRRGSMSFEETPMKSLQVSLKGDGLLNEQLVAIGSRHILAMNIVTSPMEKVRKVKELYQIYRAVIDKSDPKAHDIIDRLIMNSIISARLPNLISNLSYLYMFLPEDKLISSEGMVLKQLQKAVLRIFQAQTDRLPLERSRFADC